MGEKVEKPYCGYEMVPFSCLRLHSHQIPVKKVRPLRLPPKLRGLIFLRTDSAPFSSHRSEYKPSWNNPESASFPIPDGVFLFWSKIAWSANPRLRGRVDRRLGYVCQKFTNVGGPLRELVEALG